MSGGSLHINIESILEVELLAQKEVNSVLGARPSSELEVQGTALPDSLGGLSADLGGVWSRQQGNLGGQQVPLSVIESLVDGRSGQGGVVVVVLELPEGPGVELVGSQLDQVGGGVHVWPRLS